MYKEIFTPTAENHTFEIPEEFYGKEIYIEIIKSSTGPNNKNEKLKKLEASLKGYRVDLSNYKFTRDNISFDD